MANPEKAEAPVPSRETAVESLDKIVKDIQRFDEQYEEDSKQARQALKEIKDDFKATVASFPKDLSEDIQTEIAYVEKLLDDMRSSGLELGGLGLARYIGSPTVQLPTPEGVVGKMGLSPMPDGNVVDLGNTKLRAGDLVISFVTEGSPQGMVPSRLYIEGGEDKIDAGKAEGLLVSNWKNIVDPQNHEVILKYARQLYAHTAAQAAVEGVRAFTQTPGSGFVEDYDYSDYQDFLQTKAGFYRAQITRVAGGKNIVR